ncbi:hypothetical protein L6R49_11840 [Myxococcota bacterium]|nr:hypothetical protein [Myxococcota bacterium]
MRRRRRRGQPRRVRGLQRRR